MMTTLTPEQLEATRDILLDRMVPEWCVDDEHAAFWRNRVKAAFALALRGLDTVPRPIEEAPDDEDWTAETPMNFEGDGWTTAFSEESGKPLFFVWQAKTDFGYETTHFTPLSALPESKP